MAGKEADAKRHQTTKPHLPASKLLCLVNPMLKPQCRMTFSKKRHMAIYEQGQIFSWGVDIFGDGSNADHCSVPVLAGTWPALGNREISPLAPSTNPYPTQPLKKKKRKEDTIYSTKITRGQRLKLLLPLLDTFFGACHTSTLSLSSGGATEHSSNTT